jgi:uncharacterized protein
MNSRNIPAVIFMMAAFSLMLTGCSTIFDARKQKLEIMEKYDAGDYDGAALLIAEKAKARENTGDGIMWLLDEGTIEFDQGKFKPSLEAFRKAEKQVNEYDRRAQISVRDSSSEIGSAFTNSNAIAYRGMCRDRVLLNVYKSLDYFALGRTEGALVELRRARYAQKSVAAKFREEIEQEQKKVNKQNAKNRQSGGNSTITFKKLSAGSAELRKIQKETEAHSNKTYRDFMNPFVSYMSAIGYLIENNFGEACVDFRRLNQMEAANPLLKRDFVTCARITGEELPDELKKIKSWPYPLNQNIVYIIFADGRGAAYKQYKIALPIPFVGYTGVAFPVVEYFKQPMTKMQVIGPDAKKLGEAVSICNMDAVVANEYSQRLPMMITRLAISYLTKEIASQAALIAARQGGTAGLIAVYAGTSLYKFLFNTADTRCWETIPKRYMMTHFALPQGRRVTLAIDAKAPVTQVKGGSEIKLATSSLKLTFPKPANFFIVYVRRARNGKLTARVFPVNK